MFLFADHEAIWGPALAYQPALSLSDRFDITALVSEEDHRWAMQWRWSFKWAAGAKANKGGCIYAYRQIRIAGRKETLWLHREVTWRAYGKPPSERHMADHWNGDTLDCRRGNLRWATPSENAKNRLGQLARELETNR